MGSGVVGAGVVGSGVVCIGVVDSGVVITGVVGSGVVITGVVGSGVVVTGVVGSGVVITGVVGSGVVGTGVVGSGVCLHWSSGFRGRLHWSSGFRGRRCWGCGRLGCGHKILTSTFHSCITETQLLKVDNMFAFVEMQLCHAPDKPDVLCSGKVALFLRHVTNCQCVIARLEFIRSLSQSVKNVHVVDAEQRQKAIAAECHVMPLCIVDLFRHAKHVQVLADLEGDFHESINDCQRQHLLPFARLVCQYACAFPGTKRQLEAGVFSDAPVMGECEAGVFCREVNGVQRFVRSGHTHFARVTRVARQRAVACRTVGLLLTRAAIFAVVTRTHSVQRAFVVRHALGVGRQSIDEGDEIVDVQVPDTADESLRHSSHAAPVFPGRPDRQFSRQIERDRFVGR